MLTRCQKCRPKKYKLFVDIRRLHWENFRLTGVGWLKSTNLLLCLIFVVSEIMSTLGLLYITTKPCSGFLLTPIMMTLNNPECTIVRLISPTFDYSNIVEHIRLSRSPVCNYKSFHDRPNIILQTATLPTHHKIAEK